MGILQKTLLSFGFHIAADVQQWQPTNGFYIANYSRRTMVFFDVLKSAFILRNAFMFFFNLGFVKLSTICIHEKIFNYTMLFLINKLRLLGFNFVLFFRWPSGIITNYFVVRKTLFELIKEKFREYSPHVLMEFPIAAVLTSLNGGLCSFNRV